MIQFQTEKNLLLFVYDWVKGTSFDVLAQSGFSLNITLFWTSIQRFLNVVDVKTTFFERYGRHVDVKTTQMCA